MPLLLPCKSCKSYCTCVPYVEGIDMPELDDEVLSECSCYDYVPPGSYTNYYYRCSKHRSPERSRCWDATDYGDGIVSRETPDNTNDEATTGTSGQHPEAENEAARDEPPTKSPESRKPRAKWYRIWGRPGTSYLVHRERSGKRNARKCRPKQPRPCQDAGGASGGQ